MSIVWNDELAMSRRLDVGTYLEGGLLISRVIAVGIDENALEGKVSRECRSFRLARFGNEVDLRGVSGTPP